MTFFMYCLDVLGDIRSVHRLEYSLIADPAFQAALEESLILMKQKLPDKK